MIIEGIRDLNTDRHPLRMVDFAVPDPGPEEVLIKVSVCGVCHTELDEIEGRTPPRVYPVIPGHQVVGIVEKRGHKVKDLLIGERVGVAWIFKACGSCEFCISGKENLCDDFTATGRDVHGGYAEYMVAPANYAIPIPDAYKDAEVAPLLCAGAIGFRALKLSGVKGGQILGLTGFGASGHIVLKFVRDRYPNIRVFVFARSRKEQKLATELGAEWSGDTTDIPPEKLHAVIDTTPAWKPVVHALKHLRPAGRLVINAIRKEDHDKKELMKLVYHEHLWEEKEVVSVANITLDDVIAFLEEAVKVNLKPIYREYPLEEANTALLELKEKKIRGAKVLRVDQ